MGKSKSKEVEQDVEMNDENASDDDEDRSNVSIIANPLANKKLVKRCLKLEKKGEAEEVSLLWA